LRNLRASQTLGWSGNWTSILIIIPFLLEAGEKFKGTKKGNHFMLWEKKERKRRDEWTKKERQRRKGREKGREGEKKGRKRKGKEGKEEY
jgi:hypothetical protein